MVLWLHRDFLILSYLKISSIFLWLLDRKKNYIDSLEDGEKKKEMPALLNLPYSSSTFYTALLDHGKVQKLGTYLGDVSNVNLLRKSFHLLRLCPQIALFWLSQPSEHLNNNLCLP